MKRLFIRFFTHKNNGVPTYSHPVCTDTTRDEIKKQLVADEAENIVAWMINHPEGKVDFIESI